MISAEYLREQQNLHRNPNYGVMSLVYGPMAEDIRKAGKYKTVLDYGAGKSRLRSVMADDVDYRAYDPAVPDISEKPQPAEFVCCIDVLEHIEPMYLDEVLLDLKALTQKAAFLTIHCGPAAKVLSDGRNAHLIQQKPAWWVNKIEPLFMIEKYQFDEHGIVMLVLARDQ
jgi:hypothetical protein